MVPYIVASCGSSWNRILWLLASSQLMGRSPSLSWGCICTKMFLHVHGCGAITSTCPWTISGA